MLNLLDPPAEIGPTQLRQRQARKAYLLRQGQLLTAAYEAGQLRAMLEQLKAEPHRQTQQREAQV